MANARKLPRVIRAMLTAFLVLCSVVVVLVSLLSVKAAEVIAVKSPVRFLPVIMAVLGLAVITVCLGRRRKYQATLILAATIWVTILAMQFALLPAFSRYLPATQLAASVPDGVVLYTSRAAGDWASSVAFNLPPRHTVERLVGDTFNERCRQP